MSEARSFDVIVVGVGSMGAAACYQLAKRGVRVLGLEQFDIPHGLGSYHGHSRIIRLAYFEHPDYVPLLRRAYSLWDELGESLGQPVIHRTGGLMIGPPGSAVVEGSLRSCIEHRLPHEMLNAAEAMCRFPQFSLPADYRVLYDQEAGLVLPERAVAGYAELALRHGAELHGREAVQDWSVDGGGVRVQTDKSTYSAGQLIICGGAWTDRLVRNLGVPLVVSRQPLGWFWPKSPAAFELGQLPVWIMEHRDGTNHYGFPMLPDQPGLKLATHDRLDATDVDSIDRNARPQDEAALRRMLKRHLREADGPLLSMRVCMYTNSPDGHFIVDRHPDYRNVTIACGFSGHGFKFASVMGEVLADLATAGRSKLPIEFLGLNRFAGTGKTAG